MYMDSADGLGKFRLPKFPKFGRKIPGIIPIGPMMWAGVPGRKKRAYAPVSPAEISTPAPLVEPMHYQELLPSPVAPMPAPVTTATAPAAMPVYSETPAETSASAYAGWYPPEPEITGAPADMPIISAQEFEAAASTESDYLEGLGQDEGSSWGDIATSAAKEILAAQSSKRRAKELQMQQQQMAMYKPLAKPGFDMQKMLIPIALGGAALFIFMGMRRKKRAR